MNADKLAETPRTDGFEIVVAGESPILGNRYRMWADFARQLERELAAVVAERDAMKTVIEKALRGGTVGLQWSDLNAYLLGLESALTQLRADLAKSDADRNRLFEVNAKQVVEMDALKAEAEASAPSAHTCNPTCQRPVCVLRRERDDLKAGLERANGLLRSAPITCHPADDRGPCLCSLCEFTRNMLAHLNPKKTTP